MSEPLFIDKYRSLKPSEDYQLLRAKGIEHIQQLAGKIWSDYNIHDPGITILEMLCYAITDLAYRTEYSMEDLLSDSGSAEGAKNFFTAREILPCQPVTEIDLRKVMIDVPGVRNAWLSMADALECPVFIDRSKDRLTTTSSASLAPLSMDGVYNISLQLEDEVQTKDEVIRDVENRLQRHRNLCEDFYRIEAIEAEDIVVCADLEVSPQADADAVLAELLFQLEQFLSPSINFYSVSEMLAKSKPMDEIFEGPSLDHGFIDDDELSASALKEVVHVSDVINLMMDVEHVVAVKRVLLTNYYRGAAQTLGEKWCLKIGAGRGIRLNRSASMRKTRCHKGVIPCHIDEGRVEEHFVERTRLKRHSRLKPDQYDLQMPEGEARGVGGYSSIQHDFPLVYGIGREGISSTATPLRHAQAKQLKAYLLFFEQMLANYFSQLANLQQLFSWEETKQTYFSQILNDVPGWNDLYAAYEHLPSDLDALSSEQQQQFEQANELFLTKLNAIAESEAQFLDRRSRCLDHLMARFCEQFTDYVMVSYALEKSPAARELIADKQRFIRDYPVISASRGRGFNYRDADALWLSDNVSGLQRRVCRLLGIDSYLRMGTADTLNGSFEIEEILSDGGEKAYRFRLKAESGRALFRVSKTFATIEQAYAAMVKLVICGVKQSNFKKRSVADGKTSFELVDDDEQTIARSPRHFDSEADLQREVEGVVARIKSIDAGFEHFYLIEHILLRPTAKQDQLLKIAKRKEEGCSCASLHDPYSFRATVVVPCWPSRFRNMGFRSFFESNIRMEAPAHVHIKICWVPHDEMLRFEKAYRPWLEARAAEKPDQNLITKLQNQLIPALCSLRSVYPESRLAGAGDKEITNPVVLGQSSLGTMKEDNNGDE